MKQYIDKSALVAEIEKRINFNEKLNAHSRLDECNAILSFIDSLEVKEVDLDGKGEWKNNGGFGSTWDPDSPDYCPD